MVRTVRVVMVVVGAVLVLGACAKGGQVDAGMVDNGATTTVAPSTTASGVNGGGTEGDASRWGTCLTRIAYREAGDQVTSPDSAVRAAGLATLRGLPVPEGHAEAWTTLLTFSERFDELAAGVDISDPDEFSDAMYKAMRDEPSLAAMTAMDDDEGEALSRLGADPACDPTGLPTGFGCAAPEACTQAWAAAAHEHDQRALELLAQQDVTGDKTPAATLAAISCEEDGPFTTCTGSGTPPPGTDYTDLRYKVTWARTADGRWYGIGATSVRFKAVASAIG